MKPATHEFLKNSRIDRIVPRFAKTLSPVRRVLVECNNVFLQISNFREVHDITESNRIHVTSVDEHYVTLEFRIVANKFWNRLRRIAKVNEESVRKEFLQVVRHRMSITVISEIKRMDDYLFVGCKIVEGTVSEIKPRFTDYFCGWLSSKVMHDQIFARDLSRVTFNTPRSTGVYDRLLKVFSFELVHLRKFDPVYGTI